MFEIKSSQPFRLPSIIRWWDYNFNRKTSHFGLYVYLFKCGKFDEHPTLQFCINLLINNTIYGILFM